METYEDAWGFPEARAVDEAVRRASSELERFRSRLMESDTTFRAEAAVADLSRRERTPSAEIDRLAARAIEGDPTARERLIEALLPRVAALARDYATPGLEYADLVQEGCVGLLRALARYDPRRGTPFWAYAVWWVRQALQEARGHFLRPLRLPPRALAQLSHVKSSHKAFYARERREPSLAELSDESGVDARQVESLLHADRRARSLAERLETAEGEIGMLGDLLDDPLSSDAYEEVLDSLAGRQVRSLLSRLTEREREIVSARFGLGAGPPERLAAVGERLGVSAERVRQIEEMALAKLRRRAVD